MLFRSIILCLLVASPALGSAIKGYRAEEAPTKGLHREETKGGRLLTPVEQYKGASKTHQAKLEIKEERKEEQRVEEFHQQREQVAEQKLEDLSQQKQEQLSNEPEPLLTQQRVEAEAPAAPTKIHRYEAKPQIVQEAPALAKGQKPLDIEPQRVEKLESTKGQRAEQFESAKGQAKLETFKQEQQQERFEQVQREEQVEIRQEQQEQRRLDESLLQQQQILAADEVQQIRQEPILQQTKGGPAPLGQAEPYAFEYSVDGSSRRESGDTNGYVRGQYTLQGPDGSSRIVDYVADANGFRASVNTNEFGTEARSPAAVDLRSSQPEAQDISLRLEGKTREFLNPPQPQQPLLAVKGAPALPPKPENWQSTKTFVQREPQQLLVQAEPELPRATKGLAKLEEPQQLLVKAPLPAASKGEIEPKQQEQIELIQASGPSIDRRPVADYRAPKPAIPIRASGFESATAHRQLAPVRPATIVHHHPIAPAVPLRPVAPARSHYRQPPAPLRVHYQPERHYPLPVYRQPPRAIVGEQQPRALNLDDEALNSSFDRSS